MTPSPYQAASPHSSLHASSSDRDARHSTTDWRGADRPAANSVLVEADTRLDVLAASSAPRAASSVPGAAAAESESRPSSEAANKLAEELRLFTEVADALRRDLIPAKTFKQRCQQAFDIANDLFGNSPTWVCFYRELLGARGMLSAIFTDSSDQQAFRSSDQYQQIQGMLTALRSRDLPENDPIDPLRMITVRLPKSLHEAMVDEAALLNISINKLCISRMLQLLDPAMIPETTSKPRGRKPRTRSAENPSVNSAESSAVNSAESSAVNSAESSAKNMATPPTSGSRASGDPATMHAPAAAQPPASPGRATRDSNHSDGNHSDADGSDVDDRGSRGFEFTSHIRRP